MALIMRLNFDVLALLGDGMYIQNEEKYLTILVCKKKLTLMQTKVS